MRGSIVAAAGVLAASLALAGCAPEPVPELTPPPVPEYAPPALTVDQTREVLDQVREAIEAADATSDAAELGDRIAEPARSFRAEQFALASATDGAFEVPPLWTDSEILVISATDSWPREVLAVTNVGEGSTVRLYLALVQDTARDPYRLVAWARLLPGVETPVFASSDIGSAPVGADTEGLRFTPSEALDQLASVLSNPESENAANFADDPFRPFLTKEVEGLKEGVQVAGEVSTSSTPGDVVFGIGTAEGGAVIMGTVSTVVTLRKTIDGSKLSLGSDMAALGGTELVEASADATYQEMVALYIPPEGSDDPLQLLGAERVLTSVERHD